MSSQLDPNTRATTTTMTSKPRWGAVAVRMIVASIAILALGGPSPGHVGSCDGSAETANVGEFCTRYRTWFCARELQGGRLSAADYSNCAAGITTFCAGFMFTPGCEPTTRRADSCISAMSDSSRTATPSAMLAECNFCDSGV